MSEKELNAYRFSPENKDREKDIPAERLYVDICNIIDSTRQRIATYLNAEICMTNWHVGKRIKEDVLRDQRAEYGKQTIKNLSLRLTMKYGKGWSEKSLRHCLRAAETFT